ncbi:MAG: hypothetical protein JSR26_09990 [Proteobacteria bacterium]|nr:hypothetical protein [Pseudomonadota bacterium]
MHRIAMMLAVAVVFCGCTTTHEPPQSAMTHYDENIVHQSTMADTARRQLTGLRCAKDFKEITADAIIEVYQGTCVDGRIQRISCDESGCRQSK